MAIKEEDYKDKSTWGDGIWQEEPDEIRFEHMGLPCLMLRGPVGCWNGYVGVSPGHPCYGKDYDDVEVNVHGGLTYANYNNERLGNPIVPNKKDITYWFGFDTAHCFDYMPAMAAISRSLGFDDKETDTYRDSAYVKKEVRSLAEQLANYGKQ